MTLVDFDDFVLWVTLGIILGGRTGYVLFYNLPHIRRATRSKSSQLWKGGMSFHGGFTGCVVAVVLFARKRGISILSLGDLTCAVGPIGLFLGRIANFINGELWGRPTDVPWAMVFPGGGPLPRHPSQLYEAALEGLVLLAVLALLMRAGALKRPGLIIGCFACFYAIARSTCEFFREPDAQLGFLWGGATMGQLLSIPLFIAGLAFIVLCGEASAAADQVMSDNPPLEAEIRRRIAAAGPMPVSEYMALCLADDEHGYYTTRDPFGAGGDFITAPEVSQMFGEMIGLWMAAVWKQMGSPENIRVIELGPGRGTMMKDALRAAKVMPGFREAVVMHLVEISPALEALAAAHAGASVDADLLASRRWPRCHGRRHRRRQRILRRAADQSGGEDRARLARAPDRNRRSAGNLAFTIAPDPLPQFEPPAAAGGAQRAGGIDLRMARRRRRDGARHAARARRRRRAGDRLRPRAKRRRRNLAGGRPARLCRSADRARQHRSHRACGFPGAGATRWRRWGRSASGRSRSRNSCAASAS